MLKKIALAASALTLALVHVSAEAQVNFQEIKPPDSNDVLGFYNKIYFVEDLLGFLVGEQTLEDEKAAVSFSNDNGKTWEIKGKLAPDRLMGGAFVDKKHGWVVGEGGSVLHTRDGGENWRIQTSKVSVDLQSAFFLDEKTGWAVGSNSTVVYTTSGGRSWNILLGGTPSENVGEGEVTYLDVHFFDKKNGILVGAGKAGVVMATSDGGSTWILVHTSALNYASLAFGDENNGWAVGRDGLLEATTDGGKTWTPQNSGVDEDLKDVAAADDKTAWFSGDNGTIGYTVDGGKTWSLIEVKVEYFGKESPLKRTVAGIAAFKKKAWAMTDYGRVIHFQLQ